MVKNKEININSRYCSLDKPNIIGDFHFVGTQGFLSDEKYSSLDYRNVTIEKSPLILNPSLNINLVKE